MIKLFEKFKSNASKLKDAQLEIELLKQQLNQKAIEQANYKNAIDLCQEENNTLIDKINDCEESYDNLVHNFEKAKYLIKYKSTLLNSLKHQSSVNTREFNNRCSKFLARVKELESILSGNTNKLVKENREIKLKYKAVKRELQALKYDLFIEKSKDRKPSTFWSDLPKFNSPGIRAMLNQNKLKDFKPSKFIENLFNINDIVVFREKPEKFTGIKFDFDMIYKITFIDYELQIVNLDCVNNKFESFDEVNFSEIKLYV